MTAGPARAQTFPSRPITLVVPFPGRGRARRRGPPDGRRHAQDPRAARRRGERARGRRHGRHGNVAKAAPDGHTILLGSVATHAIAAGIYPKLPYDPIASFAPITQLTRGPLVLAVAPQVAAASVAELIAAAKASPGQDQLRVHRQRHRAARGRRTVQVGRGHRRAAHPLPGRRAGHDGADGGRGLLHHRQHPAGQAADQRREAQGAWR
jgi:hypothetical protein